MGTGRGLVFAALALLASAAAASAGCNSVLGIDAAALSDGGTGGPDGTGGPATVFVADNKCSDYCNDIQLACPAGSANQEYIASEGDAGSVCTQLCNLHFQAVEEPEGPVDLTEALPTTDTISCRVWHANVAFTEATEAPVHCPHAGPLGGDTCGTVQTACNSFCTAAVQACPTSYASLNDCMSACVPDPDAGAPGFPYVVGAGADGGLASDLQTAGNTLNCRMYHLEARLSQTDPTLQAAHCMHLSKASTPDTCGAN